MSAMDLESLLSQLPPGADIFEGVQLYIDSQVFPSLSDAFWAQLYAVVGILALIIICIVSSLVAKAIFGRLTFIVQDGNCSRLDPKTAVPILWALGAILQLIFAFTFKYCIEHHMFTRFMGATWILIYLPPSISYALLSASVAAGAPPLRRILSKSSYGLLWYNGAVLIWLSATIAGAFPAAFRHADSLVVLSNAYKEITEFIGNARAQQSLEALFGLQEPVDRLLQANDEYNRATQIANGVMSAYILLYIVTGSLPAIMLSRMVYKKITRLEDSSRASSTGMGQSFNSSGHEYGAPVINIELEETSPDTGSSHIRDQPKDRPFAHLVDLKTTMYPHRFHTILQAKEQTSQERAKRLRAVLASDLRMHGVYFLLLFIYLALCLFLACNGNAKMKTTKAALLLGYVWPTWNFVVPASIMAGLLVWEAVNSRTELNPQVNHDIDILRRNSRAFRGPEAELIECSQVVNVVYTEEKDPEAAEKLKRRYFED